MNTFSKVSLVTLLLLSIEIPLWAQTSVSNADTIKTAACGSYKLNDSTYTKSGTYNQMLQTVKGTDSTITLILTVNPLPTVTTSAGSTSPAAVCPAASITMNATATGGTTPYTYSWSPSTAGTNTTTPSSTLIFTPASGTTGSAIFCTVTDANGCKATSITQIQVYPNPTVSVTATVSSVCPGNSVTLSAATATKYQWSTKDTTASITVKPTASTTYTVTGTNSYGCKATVATAIGLYPSPTVTISASSESVTYGLRDTLTAKGAYSYVWSNSATGATIAVTPLANTTYTVTGTTSAGCSGVASRVVTVTALATDATLKAINLSYGALNVAFSPTVLNYTVALPPDTTVIPTVTVVLNSAYATDSVFAYNSSSGSTTIRVLAQDGKTIKYYTVAFKPATVLVTGISISSSTIQQSITIGGTIALSATVNPLNADNQNYMWTSTDTTIAKVDATGLVTGIKAGTVRINAVSTAVSTVKGGVYVTVIPKDTIAVIKSFANISVTVGKKIESYVIANHFKGTGITYTVNSSNNAIVSTALTTAGFGLVANSAGVDTILVTATTAKGATATQTFTVTVSDSVNKCSSLTVTDTIVHVKCAGEYTGSVTLNVTGGTAPYTYKWSNTRTDNSIVGMPAGTYSVLVLDANACASLQTVIITEPAKITIADTITNPTCGYKNGNIALTVSGGTGTYTYKWNEGSTNDTILNKPAGLYWVTVTDGVGCTKAKAFEMNDSKAPIIVLDTVVPSSCNSGSWGKIILTVIKGAGSYTFRWSDSITTKDRIKLKAGYYALTATDAANCKASIVVNVPPVAVKQPEIALVTVSQLSNDNLVVWLKDTTTSAINYYTVYRETISKTFTPVTQIQYANISVFKDSLAAHNQSWRYRLSETDYCGNESPLSAVRAEYKTMHLQTSSTQSAISLTWDAYEGYAFDSYVVYRNDSVMDTVSANVARYVDANPPKGTVKYYVAVNLVNAIPTLKSDNGPFSQSLSNMAESQLLSAPITNAEEAIIVYPNPATSYFSLSTHDNVQVQVYTADGILVKSQLVRASDRISTNNLPAGLYLVKIMTGKNVVTKSLLIK